MQLFNQYLVINQQSNAEKKSNIRMYVQLIVTLCCITKRQMSIALCPLIVIMFMKKKKIYKLHMLNAFTTIITYYPCTYCDNDHAVTLFTVAQDWKCWNYELNNVYLRCCHFCCFVILKTTSSASSFSLLDAETLDLHWYPQFSSFDTVSSFIFALSPLSWFKSIWMLSWCYFLLYLSII